MPTRRSARNTLFRLIGAIAVATCLAQAATAQSDDRIELTLDEARVVAIEALRSGDPGLAVQMARGLLQADPKDPVAYYVMANAYGQLKQPRLGRIAAARAYRYAQTGPDRFRAAQLAARLSYAENRPTLTQIWLRRTVIHAPTEEDEIRVGEDYKVLRQINPWSLRVRTDLTPSSNVNNGADTALQIIDGVPVIGVLSGTARALSGLIGSIDLTTSYRLRASAISATSLSARFFVQRVALSSSAQNLAPAARNSDFASTYVDLSLRHGWAVGEDGAASVDAGFGESWYGGERNYRFARIAVDRDWVLPSSTFVELNALAERRFDSRYLVNEAKILGLGAQLNKGLENGDRLGLTVALRDTDAQSINGTFQSASLRTTYTWAQPVGPARISAGIVLGYSDYPVYQSGLFVIPGGRQDKSVYGDVSLFFDKFDYAGFGPMLRFRAGRKKSNDSRFSMREFSVALGIQSKF